MIYNEGSNFSVGANLGLALFAANVAVWPMVEDLVAKGQKVYRKLKYAPFPVVGAPSGMALGGGCEICLHCAAVQAHAETYMGLVEVGVGVIPAWGGCTELLIRWVPNPKRPRGPMPPLAQAFETIGMAKVAKSAAEAKELLFLRPSDGITMNRDRLLADAKAKALALVAGYQPPEPSASSRCPGPSGRLALELAVDALRLRGVATPHDEVVAEQLASCCPAATTDITDAGRRRRPAEARARGLHDADQAAGDARPHRAHARDRQAAAELTATAVESPHADLPGAAARHALRPPRAARRSSSWRRCRATRRRRADLIDPVLEEAAKLCRERAAAAQPRGRRGGLRLRERRRAHAHGLQGGLRRLRRAAAGRGSPPIPPMAARACPRPSSSWSTR